MQTTENLGLTLQGAEDFADIEKLNENFEKLDSEVENKMDNKNPTGTGALSMNRKAGTEVGDKSFAEGFNTTASNNYSHAEGYETVSSGWASHAEGNFSEAHEVGCHAEGRETVNSISPTGILEVDFNRTANDTTKSWAFGFVIKDSANTRIEVHNFRANAMDDRLVTEVNQSKYITNFVANTVGYKIRLDLTTMKGTLSGGHFSSEVTFDLVNKANTDSTNSYFYDDVTGTIVVTGIRYKR